jgi:hypothetical protein
VVFIPHGILFSACWEAVEVYRLWGMSAAIAIVIGGGVEHMAVWFNGKEHF